MAYVDLPEEDERRKRAVHAQPDERRGLGALLRNKPVLLALGMGASAAARGGDFGQGLGQGLQLWSALEQQRAGQAAAEAQARAREQFGAHLSEDERLLFEIAPEAVIESRLKSPKSSTAKQKYDELLALGKDPNEAFALAYGGKGMRIRTGEEPPQKRVVSAPTPSLAPHRSPPYVQGLNRLTLSPSQTEIATLLNKAQDSILSDDAEAGLGFFLRAYEIYKNDSSGSAEDPDTEELLNDFYAEFIADIAKDDAMRDLEENSAR